MKKKLMMVAAVVGLLSLNACVDDAVSPGVDAIRTAKAKQLEALAKKAEAEGEAALINANALKALNEAEAEYKKALAAETLNDVEEAKQKFAIQLEQIKAEAEAALWLAKQQAASNERQILENAEARVASLYTKYSAQLKKVNTTKRNILDAQANIAGLTADITTAESYVKTKTLKLNNQIDQEKNRKAFLESLDVQDKSKLLAEMLKLEKEVDKSEKEVEALKDKKDDALDAWNDAKDALGLSNATSDYATVNAYNLLRNDFGFYSMNVQYNSENGVTEIKSIDQAQVVLRTRNLEQAVEAAQDYLGKPSTSTVPTTSVVYAELENAQKELKDAQKALADATTDQEKKDAKDWIALADARVINADKAVKAAEKDIEDAQAELTSFKAAVESFSGNDWKAYTDALTSTTTLAEAYDTADKAHSDAQDANDVLDTTLADVTGLYYDTIGISEAIADATDTITDLQAQIVNLDDVDTAKDALEAEKVKIADLQVDLTEQEALVKMYKAALDAALAE